MLIEEEEGKVVTEVNPDAIIALFEDDSAADEEVPLFRDEDDEQVDEIDIAFQANDEQYW
jgi:hypothetical protein